ncbi:hypothetical protein MPNT_190064 [Candidatus Methylacidithermus pantelleriae]|uniref:Uncharacterized protein n=1 Tax=Candidatus Methylacidithermus pantelleriae TaxID=2744239 RepID=A0A8J2BS17_9BACT|nr:hypothetical protein MPNT_190064 [Candidatus Methylacidithermus pantelleriae]
MLFSTEKRRSTCGLASKPPGRSRAVHGPSVTKAFDRAEKQTSKEKPAFDRILAQVGKSKGSPRAFVPWQETFDRHAHPGEKKAAVGLYMRYVLWQPTLIAGKSRIFHHRKSMNPHSVENFWASPSVRRTLYLLPPAIFLSAWICPFFGIAMENAAIALCSLNCLLASFQLRHWGLEYWGFAELDYGAGGLVWRGFFSTGAWERSQRKSSHWKNGRRRGLSWGPGGDPRWN